MSSAELQLPLKSSKHQKQAAPTNLNLINFTLVARHNNNPHYVPRLACASLFITHIMNAPLIAARRTTSSICLSCRRNLLRQFSSSPAFAFPEFQSYRLNPHTPSTPRNAGVPDTSITHPIEPPMPRVHETRPPKTPRDTDLSAASKKTSVPEREAQKSQQAFANASSTEKKAATTSTSTATSETPQATLAPKAKPRSKLRAPRKAAMKLTPSAVDHLRALLDQPDPKLIKVGVRNRGCSGLAYHLEYVDKAGAFDETVEQDGVKVLIDSKALFSIIGSEMDWVEDKLNQRFVFRNPNISEYLPV